MKPDSSSDKDIRKTFTASGKMYFHAKSSLAHGFIFYFLNY